MCMDFSNAILYCYLLKHVHSFIVCSINIDLSSGYVLGTILGPRNSKVH